MKPYANNELGMLKMCKRPVRLGHWKTRKDALNLRILYLLEMKGIVGNNIINLLFFLSSEGHAADVWSQL